MNLESKIGAVLYIRSARSSELECDDNLRDQEERCRAYCAQQGWVVKAVFKDRRGSGISLTRPGFQKLLSFCQDHHDKVRYVVVSEFDRFARNLRVAAEALRQLNCSGVLVRSSHDTEVDLSALLRLEENIVDAFRKYLVESTPEK